MMHPGWWCRAGQRDPCHRERSVGEFGALVRVLDGRLADSNGDDIADITKAGDQVKEGG